jgi:Predicted nucleotide-binding protein containing TIR-like domain
VLKHFTMESRMIAKVFVGSSTESLPIAKIIQRLLTSRNVVVTVWDSYLNEPGQFHLDRLARAADEFDFAVFIFSPDDIAEIRGTKTPIVRDNVIFEAGLFIKSLSRERTLIVLPRSKNGERVHVLTDFLGLTLAYYEEIETPKDWSSRLAPICTSIDDQIKQLSLELPGRSAALVGNWNGELCQGYGPGGIPTTFNTEAKFEIAFGLIRAFLTFRGDIAPGKDQVSVNLDGKFIHDSFLKLDYRYADHPGAMAFGTVVARLNDLGSQLAGQYLGYGAYSERLVSGTITLRKVIP